MYSTPVDLSSSYLRSAVEASLDIKKDQVDPNNSTVQNMQCLSIIPFKLIIDNVVMVKRSKNLREKKVSRK